MAASVSDRNLLFGILALQMDFISRDALIKGMHAWVLEKSKPLAQILMEQGDFTSDVRDCVEVMIDKHLQIHGNDAQQSLAALGAANLVRNELRLIADPELSASLAHVSVARMEEDDPLVTRSKSLMNIRQFGNYRVLQILSKGAMGAVYLAYHTLLKRPVVLRIPHFDANEEPDVLARFYREAGACVKLSHRNICPIFDVGSHNNIPYVAMQYIAGETLAALIQRSAPLSEQLAIRIVATLAAALGEAHRQGIIHRNLKAANVMIDYRGEPIVMDFGLTLSSSLRTVRLTGFAGVCGTPAYMAPEQVRGDVASIGPACDIYSLGVILYELLTARLPFEGSVESVLAKVLTVPAAPPSTHRPALDPRLGAVCMRAMEKVVGNRFASMSDMAAALNECVRLVAPRVAATAHESPRRSQSMPEKESVESGDPRDPPRCSSQPHPLLGDAAQFTVYRPECISPGQWHALLAFAHFANADANQQVADQARRVLGEDVAKQYQSLTVASTQPIPRSRILTFVPLAEGIEFNPPERSFVWSESIHREEFRCRAAATLAHGVTATGQVSVFLGSVLLADIPICFRIASTPVSPSTPAIDRASPYRLIFASYSHRDTGIVEEFEELTAALGDRFLRDRHTLRAGEDFDTRLLELIEQADIFQLFWSRNAMHSEYVLREMQHAINLNRPEFVRPTYWELPFPEDPQRGLPPADLRRMHFHRLTLPPRLRRRLLWSVPGFAALLAILGALIVLMAWIWLWTRV